MSVYGYCRLALADDQEMAQQRKEIADYCEVNHLKVDEYFYDNGASGLTLERDGLQAMLNSLKEGDVVVVKDIARLTRDMCGYAILKKHFNDAGVALKIIDQQNNEDLIFLGGINGKENNQSKEMQRR